ncbi:hypothetical protein [Staphylococcus virus vB_SurM-PSU6]|nr:hypothetical protein [Staphylococcus virus vB_SurM-PSU6]
MNKDDYIGLKYGRLTVISWDGKRGIHHYVKCKCDCGNTKSIRLYRLKTGETKSCGCIRKELFEENRRGNIKHGKSNSRLHTIYRSMKARCYSVKNINYSNYGGKGIEICDEWLEDFMNFYNWAHNNGYKDDLTIDRIDSNGNYEPGNCRWVDYKTQSRNRNYNKLLKFQGKELCVTEWSDLTGIASGTIHSRLRMGWSIEKTLSTPVKRKGN